MGKIVSRPRVRVKMCGMTRSNDIQHAIQLGVDAIGMVFYEKSSRGVTIDQAKSLLQYIPPFVDVVAVLVNPEVHYVSELLARLPIDLLQFHGEESSDFCEQFNKPYIKAYHVQGNAQVVKKISDHPGAKAILLDSATKTKRGGTGEAFNWELIPELSKPLILAGGLNELNIERALSLCTPYAVDVCSGVELEPGIKDPVKMQDFVNAVWRSL